jgi:RNA polymerase sigma-70 factor (ECF subfamily)
LSVVNASSPIPQPNAAPALAEARDRWFAEEVQPHEPALRAYLRRRYPTMGDIDDVVQESFLKAFLAWQRGRLTSVRGFLFTVAGNLTVSLFRRRKFIAPVPVNEMTALRVVKDDADVVENLCTREELALIAGAVAALPVRCRQVAAMRLFDGRDCRDIAGELGISEATVRVQLARAMKKCAQYCRDRGLFEEGAP